MSIRDITRNMPGPIAASMVAWEEAAIEKCRNDPAVAAAGLCYVCMCPPPCFCDDDRIASRMRLCFSANADQAPRERMAAVLSVIRSESMAFPNEPILADDAALEAMTLSLERRRQMVPVSRDGATGRSAVVHDDRYPGEFRRSDDGRGDPLMQDLLRAARAGHVTPIQGGGAAPTALRVAIERPRKIVDRAVKIFFDPSKWTGRP